MRGLESRSLAGTVVSLLLSAMFCCVHMPAQGAPLDAAAAPAYDSISIIRPTKDETIHDNAGKVDVKVTVSPALRAGVGDRIAAVVMSFPGPRSG